MGIFRAKICTACAPLTLLIVSATNNKTTTTGLTRPSNDLSFHAICIFKVKCAPLVCFQHFTNNLHFFILTMHQAQNLANPKGCESLYFYERDICISNKKKRLLGKKYIRIFDYLVGSVSKGLMLTR